jgi:hypothetical protein
MKYTRHIAALMLVVCGFAKIHAQVGFSMPVLNNLLPGQFFQVPVTVSNFDSVVSIQFVLTWDPAVVELVNVFDFNVQDLDEGDFNLDESGMGRLRLVWIGPVSGVSRPNGTSIFSLLMQVKGPPNSGTPLTFTELPPTTFFEVVRANGDVFDLQTAVLQHGFAAIGYTLSSEDVPATTLHAQVYPNPVDHTSRVYFELDAPEQVTIEVFDVQGRKLFFSNGHCPPGKYGMEIADDNMYQLENPSYLILQAGQRRAVVPLIGRQ